MVIQFVQNCRSEGGEDELFAFYFMLCELQISSKLSTILKASGNITPVAIINSSKIREAWKNTYELHIKPLCCPVYKLQDSQHV